MMGHSNLRSTQVYAVITDDKISKDMDKLMQRRETKETDQNKPKSVIRKSFLSFSNDRH